jgi:aminodeoxyfutalosine deaminase
MPRVIRARCVWPVSSEPIENGAIELEGARIKRVGRWPDLKQEASVQVEDLGEVVLMPGLINAHCHLDYTAMAGKIPSPSNFPDWVKNILQFKAHWSYTDFAKSWLDGAHMLLQSGTTTVLDIEAAPELLPDVWESTPLRVWSFLEMTGVQKRRDAAQLLQETIERIESLPASDTKKASLSPHAPYSIPPALLKFTAERSRELSLPVQMHIAESREEFQMYTAGSGPLYEWLRPQREMFDCDGCSPVEHVHRNGLTGPGLMAIHANYLKPEDAGILAKTGTSVVHCPRSHDYFGHDAFRYRELGDAGVNICLGTDSLASSRKIGSKAPELSMWPEMRLFLDKFGALPKRIIEMATLNPAKALNQQGALGELRENAWADCIALQYGDKPQERRIAELIIHEPEMRESFVGGASVWKARG